MPADASQAMSGIRRLLVEAKAGLDPWESLPEDRLPAVARHCRAQEIAEIFDELDALAREKAGVPDWDGDTRDDIGKVQEMYSRILGLVDASLLPEVAKGLVDHDGETRLWIALGLERHGRAALPVLRAALAGEADAQIRDVLVGVIGRLE